MIESRPATAHGPAWADRVHGVGLGLRSQHIDHVLRELPDVSWFEVLADNYLAPGGLVPKQLAKVREHYPVSFHCVGMSLGGTDPLDLDYLASLRRLMADIQPAWVSDHLSFTRHGGHNYHELLPLPFTRETLEHLAARICQVQDFLGCRILVENVSSYLRFHASEMEEAEFVAELMRVADCDLLLDINNIYVNAVNHGFSAQAYLARMPMDRVREIHLAGYEIREGFLLDAHNHSVSLPVWYLYDSFVQRLPLVPTLIEWDKDIPSFEVLQAQAAQARSIMHRYRPCEEAVLS